MDKKRVLVVEDRPILLRDQIEFLTEAGFDTDGAINIREAIECIRRRCYHVALIDMNLTDYSGRGGDRQGLELISYIQDLKEGTGCIVLSAEQRVEVPVRVQERGVRYLIKDEIDVPDDFIRPVAELADRVDIALFGRYKDLPAYLSRPLRRDDWEDRAMKVIGGGARLLYSTLESTLAKFLPILPPKNSQFTLSVDLSKNVLWGHFWSRATGYAIEVAIYSGAGRDVSSRHEGAVLQERQKNNVISRIWGLPEMARDSYIDSSGDIL